MIGSRLARLPGLQRAIASPAARFIGWLSVSIRRTRACDAAPSVASDVCHFLTDRIAMTVILLTSRPNNKLSIAPTAATPLLWHRGVSHDRLARDC